MWLIDKHSLLKCFVPSWVVLINHLYPYWWCYNKYMCNDVIIEITTFAHMCMQMDIFFDILMLINNLYSNLHANLSKMQAVVRLISEVLISCLNIKFLVFQGEPK